MTVTKARQLAGLAITGLAIKAPVRAVISKEVGGSIMEATINLRVAMVTSKVNKEDHGTPAIGMAISEIRKESREVLIIGMIAREANKESYGTAIIGMTTNKDLINKALMKIAAETSGRISVIGIRNFSCGCG